MTGGLGVEGGPRDRTPRFSNSIQTLHKVRLLACSTNAMLGHSCCDDYLGYNCKDAGFKV
jgi:hypothetical protein